MSPLLWSDAELEELMAGSPVLPEARSRKKALADTWAALAPKLAADPARFPAGRRAAGARKGVVVWDGGQGGGASGAGCGRKEAFGVRALPCMCQPDCLMAARARTLAWRACVHLQ